MCGLCVVDSRVYLSTTPIPIRITMMISPISTISPISSDDPESYESPLVCIAIKRSAVMPEAPLLSAMFNTSGRLFFSIASVVMAVCEQSSHTAKRTSYCFMRKYNLRVNQCINSITDGYVGCYKTTGNATATAVSMSGLKALLIYLMDYNKGMYSENASFYLGLHAGWEKRDTIEPGAAVENPTTHGPPPEPVLNDSNVLND